MELLDSKEAYTKVSDTLNLVRILDRIFIEGLKGNEYIDIGNQDILLGHLNHNSPVVFSNIYLEGNIDGKGITIERFCLPGREDFSDKYYIYSIRGESYERSNWKYNNRSLIIKVYYDEARHFTHSIEVVLYDREVDENDAGVLLLPPHSSSYAYLTDHHGIYKVDRLLVPNILTTIITRNKGVIHYNFAEEIGGFKYPFDVYLGGNYVGVVNAIEYFTQLLSENR